MDNKSTTPELYGLSKNEANADTYEAIYEAWLYGVQNGAEMCEKLNRGEEL